MKDSKLNHAHPIANAKRYREEIRKMSAQERFDKLMAIIELSYYLKNAKQISKS